MDEALNKLADLDGIEARYWDKLVGECLYVRYAGHAPDHARNKTFAQRWNIK